MIHFVTKTNYCGVHERADVEQCLSALSSLDNISLDTETTGLNPHQDKILSLQLGNATDQYVIDCTTVDIQQFKPLLENKNKLLIIQNAKFDLQFLFKQKIVPHRVWDTFVVEKLMHLGLLQKDYSAALSSMCKNYLGIEMDKTIRGQINYKGLSDDVIAYGAKDVQYLERIMELQKFKLKQLGLTRAVEYENKFVIPLAYMEFCGIHLDVQRWKDKMQEDEQKRDEALAKCNFWIADHFKDGDCITYDKLSKNGTHKFTKLPLININREGNLWTGYDLTPQVSLNWNSPEQMLALFRKCGVDVEDVDAKNLAKYKEQCSLIPLYVAYKEAAKVTSTYGDNFLKQVDKSTGRLHTNYFQFGTRTGRISSGSDESKSVNLLNLPRDARTRACFTSEPGNRFISIDYSGQESFIMADTTGDEAMLNELNHGEGDMHTLAAKMLYDQIPKDMPAKEVKEKFHDERQRAKSLEFAVFYGSQGKAIATNLNLTDEEATNLYRKFMDGFHGLEKYQSFRRKDWLDKGYILINKKTGHKSFISDIKWIQDCARRFKGNDFWNKYRALKEAGQYNDPTVQEVRSYFKHKSNLERNSINYPIQGCGALCMKTAMINFFAWLRKKDLLFKVLLCVMPYDEVCFEAPDEVADECALKMKECMVKSGAYFVTKCKLDADISYDKDGKLPNYWIH
jgi:DNA polymerase-1